MSDVHRGVRRAIQEQEPEGDPLATRPSTKDQELLDEFLRKFDAAMPAHSEFVKRVERGYRAYHGILKASSKAAQWKHTMHPPVGFNLIETIVANTVEQGLRMKVSPAPTLSDLPVEELQSMSDRSEVVEHLLRHEWRVDQMDAKQRPLLLENAIAGRAFGKSYWNLTEGMVKRQGVKEVEWQDTEGNTLGTMPTIQEITEHKTLRDHSTFEVRDSRDVILHESARNMQPWEPGGCQHLFDRGWFSKEQLKDMERSGYLKNVDDLTETRDFSDQYSDRERVLYDIQRDKDLFEVVEFWDYHDGSVWRSIIGQRRVVLREEEENPFWHGGFPLVLCRSQPQNFSLHGKGEIELIEQLQEMLWELMNQRLDNVELVNNMILLVSPRSRTRRAQMVPGRAVAGQPERRPAAAGALSGCGGGPVCRTGPARRSPERHLRSTFHVRHPDPDGRPEDGDRRLDRDERRSEPAGREEVPGPAGLRRRGRDAAQELPAVHAAPAHDPYRRQGRGADLQAPLGARRRG
jgi:hypothetical protein